MIKVEQEVWQSEEIYHQECGATLIMGIEDLSVCESTHGIVAVCVNCQGRMFFDEKDLPRFVASTITQNYINKHIKSK